MKKRLLIFLLIFSKICLAQNHTLTVSGKFNSDNRVLHLTEIIQRHLFVQEKGNIIYPETGFFFELSDKDAKKIGTDNIIVIPLDEHINYDESNEEIQLEIIPFLPDEPYIFYIKNNSKNDLYRKGFFKNPNLKDTVGWPSEYHTLLNTKEWIEHLNDNTKVTVEGTRYATMSSGECISSPTFDKMTMSELAKEQLHFVANLFTEIDEEKWTQQQWKQWFSKIMNYTKQPLSSCNPNNWNEDVNFKESYSNSAIFNTDEKTNKIYRIERVPYAEDFEEQQVMMFDMKNAMNYKRKIYTENQNKTTAIANYEVINDSLYILTEYFKWQNYKLGADKNEKFRMYDFIAEKDLLPPSLISKKGWYPILNTYVNQNLMYCTFTKDEDYKEIYIVCIETKTGKLVQIKSLKEILAASDIKFNGKKEPVNIAYGTKNQDEYLVALKTKDSCYLFKLNKDLQLMNYISINKKFEYGSTIFENADKTTLVNAERGNLTILDINMNHKTVTKTDLPILPDEDDDPIIKKEGNNLRLVTKYSEPFERGIKSLVLDANNKIISENCIFNYVPIDEESELKLQYLTKIGSDWYVYFNNNGVLRFAKITK